MPPNPEHQSCDANSQTGSVPSLVPAVQSPGSSAHPSLGAGSPPPLPPITERQSPGVRQLLALVLSVCLGLFLADGVISLVDDSLILFFDVHLLTGLRGIVFLFASLVAIVVYGLMGLTSMIPKRLFLPLTLFGLVAQLALLPILIYFHGRMQQAAWILSFCQVVVGLGILYWVQGGFKFRWPLVSGHQLEPRRFSWLNLSVFLLANAFLLVPAVLAYFVICTALALDHFSDGFIALRPHGLTVEVRKYVHNDGRTVLLVPMSHVGEPEFYHDLSQSFPTNSVILMEGVTDERNLLTNKITYQRMAASLGLAEQQREFKPPSREMVRADVDLVQFATNTIDLLNLSMLIHAKGVSPENLMKVMQYSPPLHFEEQILDDLLTKRNGRVVEEIHARNSKTETIIVPWGAAHMPGIAREIQKSGFRLQESRKFVAIQFGSAGKNGKTSDKIRGAGKAK